MAEISVAVMLARLERTYENGQPVTFDIEFVKDDGSLRKMTARNHVKHHRAVNQPGAKSNFRYRLKEKNSVLLWDMQQRQYRTVKVSRILKFNQLIVLH